MSRGDGNFNSTSFISKLMSHAAYIVKFCKFSEQRCDGFKDCVDETDEHYCKDKTIVIIDDSYRKFEILKLDKTKTECFLNLSILDVISIDGNNNMFKPKFEISLEWLDQRLKFKNLKKGIKRLLPKDELERIWKPEILLDSINQNNM